MNAPACPFERLHVIVYGLFGSVPWKTMGEGIPGNLVGCSGDDEWQ